MGHRVVAFTTVDHESTADIQATDTADLQALGREFEESGLSVGFCGAKLRGSEVWVPITGSDDLELIQHFFSQPLRWVSRGELLGVTR